MIGKIAQPTYKRQRFLLDFIRQFPNGISSTDLQKLVFLYSMNEHTVFYEFAPYQYGAYSFQMAEDITILRQNGFLLPFSRYIQATSAGEIKYPIAAERGNSLLCKTYREYPYYSINSKILGKIFDEQEANFFREYKKRYIQNEEILFNIGYEGKGIEKFINILLTNDVRMLVDVRKNPLSRKFGFSKEKLNHILKNINIEYIHIPGLGIDSAERIGLETMDDYNHLFCTYEKSLIYRTSELEYLYSLLSGNGRITLMCLEKEPEKCHRHVIRDYMVKKYRVKSVDL